MGMPRQEIWVLENQAQLGPCVTFTVGGAFDYEAGVQRPSPRWMGQVGMEWLFRLMADPQRLFTRYCVEPWHLMGPAVRDLGKALARQADPRKALTPSARNTPGRPTWRALTFWGDDEPENLSAVAGKGERPAIAQRVAAMLGLAGLVWPGPSSCCPARSGCCSAWCSPGLSRRPSANKPERCSLIPWPEAS
jgi:hypothetical protein